MLKLANVPDRAGQTLLSIRPVTTIMSDMLRGYGGIAAMGY